MQTYIIRRLLLLIPTIWVASLLVFILMRLIPGDFADKIAAQNPFFQAEDAERVRQAMGLDEPILVQYGRYMGVMADHEGAFSGILQGSIGRSLWSKEPVTKIIFDRLAATVELGFFALTIALLIALPIGTYSAIRQETLGDYAGRSFAILAIAIPNFWLGTMIVVLPSNLVGVVSGDHADPVHGGPTGKPGAVPHSGSCFGRVFIRDDHENDANHDAGGVETRLHQDGLGQGTQGEDSHPPACS